MVVWLYVGFIAFVLAMLALDLGVLNRKAHVIGAREALAWSAGWIALGLLFAVFVYYAYQGQWLGLGHGVDPADGRINDGLTATTKYLTGYIVEKSLSLDNIFVIAMIFAFFGVPAMYQHRVLFWGILGALILRGVMIGVGAQLVAAFHWVLYVFGAFLVVTAVKMLWLSNEPSNPHRNPVVRLARRVLPVTDGFHGEHFVVRAGSAQSAEAATPGAPRQADVAVAAARPGTLMLTPLALTLVTVETTDVVFAVDSIPAIFAITADPFLVFTSNVFAILGLRALYFALAAMIEKFRYLKVSLAIVLAYVGVKMLVSRHFHIPTTVSLVVIAAVLLGGAAVSVMIARLRPPLESLSAAPLEQPHVRGDS